MICTRGLAVVGPNFRHNASLEVGCVGCGVRVPLHHAVFPLMHEALDEELEVLKLLGNVEHEVVFGFEQCVAVGNNMCRIVFCKGMC